MEMENFRSFIPIDLLWKLNVLYTSVSILFGRESLFRK